MIPSETETALQKICAHIVTEVKLNEEDLSKSQSRSQAQKKALKHDKHSSFTFQKARGFVPEVAATSFSKTTSGVRRSSKTEQRQGQSFEPLESTTTLVGRLKPAAFASPDDETLWEIRNKLDVRPKTSAAACVDYAGDETSGSSVQSAHTTAITSANLTPGHSSKRISQRTDSQDPRTSIDEYAKTVLTTLMTSGQPRSDRDTDGSNFKNLLAMEMLNGQSEDGNYLSTNEDRSRSLLMNKSAPALPLADAANHLAHDDAVASSNLRKIPSLPQITQKIHVHERSPSQPTYTSYYGKSTVPSNSAAPSRPGTSHESNEEDYRRGRSMSITKGIREYIKPGSTRESRAQSRSRAPSLRSQPSLSSMRGHKEPGNGGWHGLRKKISNMSIRTRSRSSSHSRPGYDDGDEYFIDADKVDLNKNLPPLPGLDTYEAKPRHIGELMRKALPKNRLGRDTANVVIDRNGHERVMTAEEQVQRRQDLARAVMEKMTSGSMGSGDSRPTSPKETEKEAPSKESIKAEPGRNSDNLEAVKGEASIEHRKKLPTNDSPQQRKIVGHVSIVRGPGGPRHDESTDQQPIEPMLSPPLPLKARRSGASKKWAHLLGFGRGSKNSSKVVHVI